MKETVCQFGTHNGLVGVLTQPEESLRKDRPVVVFLSAGLLHRVGPFRLYISLARKLAQVGVSSLRLDLSGIGDSAASQLTASIEERILSDVRAAYDYLEEHHGASKFVVGGLCSGADDAFRAVMDDARVEGSFQFDGMGYRTKRFYRGLIIRHYLPRLLSADKWKNLIIKLIEKDKNKEVQESSQEEEDDLHRAMPTLEEASAGLAEMEVRGQKTLLIYTGGASDYYNYRGQIFDSIPEAKNYKGISECYLPKSDHTYMLKRDREEVMEVLCDWYASRWPVTA